MDSFQDHRHQSTVPVARLIGSGVDFRRTEQPFAVASNPEFMKEGAAVEDFMKPRPRLSWGGDNCRGLETLKELYDPFLAHGKSYSGHG